MTPRTIAECKDVSFNPCCVGNSSGSARRKRYSYPSRRVSILVVLEIVLEEDYGFSVDPTTLGFNPCCVGNSSGRLS